MMMFFTVLGCVVFFILGMLLAKNKINREISSLELSQSEKTAQLEKEKGILEERARNAERLRDEYEKKLSSAAGDIVNFSTEIAVWKSTCGNLREKLETQKSELEELQKKFKTEFENVANRILEEKSKKFTEQNKLNLDGILNPLKEKLKDFEDKVNKTYNAEAAERNILKGVILNLTEMNRKISEEANNLARALKGDTKKQGDWGEFRLEVILEKAGLVKGIHYRAQEVLKDEEGSLKKPDFIINLPEDKNLVVDSKVSLNAYLSFSQTENREKKMIFLEKHIGSIENHIKELNEKNYSRLYGINSPDYVLMYVPIEPAFSLAIEHNPDLFLWALEKKNVVMVTTSTLLATLSTISYIWQQDNLKRNHLEIAETAGKLYEKFVGFTNDLLLVGGKMDDAKKVYVEAMKKLSEGRGNLVSQAEKIKSLGAKVDKSKSVSPLLIDRSKDEE